MRILSFDVEDWWGYDYYKMGNRSDWEPRLNNYLYHILDLLDEKSIKATFFILGKVAASNPEVVKEIANRGHHIGCHSYSHIFWKNPSEKNVIEDTNRALGAIENCIGSKVDAYRAPAFSITRDNSWILSVLVDAGIKYDCSIFPTTRSIGGFPEYKTNLPGLIQISGCLIKEFPISSSVVFGREIVFSGGGYFRLFPYSITKLLIQKSEYVMTYFHVKDFDKDQKRVFSSLDGESAFVRYFKSYIGLGSCFDKFEKLISDFHFCSVAEADAIVKWKDVPVVSLNEN